MKNQQLGVQRVKADLTELCVKIGDRHVGSAGNRAATGYVAGRLQAAGFSVSQPDFDCIDWEYGQPDLTVGGEPVEAFAPYSISCRVEAAFVAADTIDELANRDLTGKIAVLCGELAREQIMPKNFTLHNPEYHQRIVQLLEKKQPLAVVAITTKNPELAGGWYPFPLFEDGGFDIPT